MVRSCRTGFSEILIAALWSLNNLHAFYVGSVVHLKFIFSHMTLVIPLAIPQNSAFALDKATTFYFLLFHVTRFPPTKVKYLMMTSFHLVLFPSLHLYRLEGLSDHFSRIECPYCLYPFKYLKILISAVICCIYGWCISLLTTPTTYVMSSCVWKR